MKARLLEKAPVKVPLSKKSNGKWPPKPDPGVQESERRADGPRFCGRTEAALTLRPAVSGTIPPVNTRKRVENDNKSKVGDGKERGFYSTGGP